SSLLDLAFLELDVLLRNRVVLAEGQLLGLVPRVLLGHVEEAGVGGRVEPDLDRCGLRHRLIPKHRRGRVRPETTGATRTAPPIRARLCVGRAQKSRRLGALIQAALTRFASKLRYPSPTSGRRRLAASAVSFFSRWREKDTETWPRRGPSRSWMRA